MIVLDVLSGIWKSFISIPGFLLVLSCPKSIKTILIRIFSSTMLSGASWTTFYNVFTCSMLVPMANRQPFYGYEENNLCKVLLIMLEQHCIGLLSSQCCSNTSKKKLHKKITCAMLAKHGCSDHSNLAMEAESLTKNLS